MPWPRLPRAHYLSMAAMLRNEAPYLEEWVKYHSHIGFEHFYLYENDSTDNTKEVLEELSAKYPITWRSISGKAIVTSVFEGCIAQYRRQSRWILFADGDEFVVCRTPLHDFLRKYEKYSGLTVHWYVFGSSRHQKYEPIPVIERFTRRSKDVHLCCKTFVDPMRTSKCYTSHRFKHFSHPVDEHFVPITTAVARTDRPTCDLIQINHYVTKSYEECMERRKERRLSTGKPHLSAEKYFRAHSRNDVEDLKAFNIWINIPK